jgi:SAM-dependent methyltransferase
MRSSSVTHALETFDRYGISLDNVKAIDVGGTQKFYLETERLRKGVRSHVKNLFLGLADKHSYLDREIIVTDNPLLSRLPEIKFFDQGFNANQISTESDIQADFLDFANIAPISDSFDLTVSFDTLEHVRDPFLFCKHLVSITKPGCYLYLQTVFSWKYHPSPKDYFRFSPEGLAECFSQTNVEVLECGWDVEEVSTFIFLRRSI